MWSGQAAEGSRIDDQWSSWPPTRPSQPPAQPRSAAPWRTARAPARHHAAAARCRLHSHQKHLPRHRPPASCQPQSAAWGQAASGLSGTVREGTVGQCAGGRRLASSPARAIASVSTAQPLQPSSAHTKPAVSHPLGNAAARRPPLGTTAACARCRLLTPFSQSDSTQRALSDWPGLARWRWTSRT